jgi:hypothetical protein
MRIAFGSVRIEKVMKDELFAETGQVLRIDIKRTARG